MDLQDLTKEEISSEVVTKFFSEHAFVFDVFGESHSSDEDKSNILKNINNPMQTSTLFPSYNQDAAPGVWDILNPTGLRQMKNTKFPTIYKNCFSTFKGKSWVSVFASEVEIVESMSTTHEAKVITTEPLKVDEGVWGSSYGAIAVPDVYSIRLNTHHLRNAWKLPYGSDKDPITDFGLKVAIATQGKSIISSQLDYIVTLAYASLINIKDRQLDFLLRSGKKKYDLTPQQWYERFRFKLDGYFNKDKAKSFSTVIGEIEKVLSSFNTNYSASERREGKWNLLVPLELLDIALTDKENNKHSTGSSALINKEFECEQEMYNIKGVKVWGVEKNVNVDGMEESHYLKSMNQKLIANFTTSIIWKDIVDGTAKINVHDFEQEKDTEINFKDLIAKLTQNDATRLKDVFKKTGGVPATIASILDGTATLEAKWKVGIIRQAYARSFGGDYLSDNLIKIKIMFNHNKMIEDPVNFDVYEDCNTYTQVIPNGILDFFCADDLYYDYLVVKPSTEIAPLDGKSPDGGMHLFFYNETNGKFTKFAPTSGYYPEHMKNVVKYGHNKIGVENETKMVIIGVDKFKLPKPSNKSQYWTSEKGFVRPAKFIDQGYTKIGDNDVTQQYGPLKHFEIDRSNV